jgi:hypothetical protein
VVGFFRLNVDIFASSVPALVAPLDGGVSFTRGVRLDQPLPTPLVFSSKNSARKPPSAFVGYAVPIMSNELIDTLRQAGVSNLECFPAEVRSTREPLVWTTHQAVNVVGLHACTAHGTATRELMSTPAAVPLAAIEHLVLDADRAAAGGALFRLAEDPSFIVVTAKVAEAIRAVRADLQWGLTLDLIDELAPRV